MQNECPNTDMVFGQSKNRGGAESAPFGTWAYIWLFCYSNQAYMVWNDVSFHQRPNIHDLDDKK